MDEMEAVTPFTIDLLTQAMEATKTGHRIHPLIVDRREVYLMTISPDARAFLVMIRAKDTWKRRYRAERIARKKAAGFVYLDTSIDYTDWSE